MMIKQNQLIALLLSTVFAIPGFSMEDNFIEKNQDSKEILIELNNINEPLTFPQQTLSEEDHILIKSAFGEEAPDICEAICQHRLFTKKMTLEDKKIILSSLKEVESSKAKEMIKAIGSCGLFQFTEELTEGRFLSGADCKILHAFKNIDIERIMPIARTIQTLGMISTIYHYENIHIIENLSEMDTEKLNDVVNAIENQDFSDESKKNLIQKLEKIKFRQVDNIIWHLKQKRFCDQPFAGRNSPHIKKIGNAIREYNLFFGTEHSERKGIIKAFEKMEPRKMIDVAKNLHYFSDQLGYANETIVQAIESLHLKNMPSILDMSKDYFIPEPPLEQKIAILHIFDGLLQNNTHDLNKAVNSAREFLTSYFSFQQKINENITPTNWEIFYNAKSYLSDFLKLIYEVTQKDPEISTSICQFFTALFHHLFLKDQVDFDFWYHRDRECNIKKAFKESIQKRENIETLILLTEHISQHSLLRDSIKCDGLLFFLDELIKTKPTRIKDIFHVLNKYGNSYINSHAVKYLNEYKDEAFEIFFCNFSILGDKLLPLLQDRKAKFYLWSILSSQKSQGKAEGVSVFLDGVKKKNWFCNLSSMDQAKVINCLLDQADPKKFCSSKFYNAFPLENMNPKEMTELLSIFSETEDLNNSFNVAMEWKAFEMTKDLVVRAKLIKGLSYFKDPKLKEASIPLMNALSPYFSNTKDLLLLIQYLSNYRGDLIKKYERLAKIDCYDLLLSDTMPPYEITDVLENIADDETLDSEKIRITLKLPEQFKEFPKFLKKNQAFKFLLHLASTEQNKQMATIQKAKLFFDKFPDLDGGTFMQSMLLLASQVENIQILKYVLDLPEGKLFNEKLDKKTNAMLRLAFAQLKNIEKIQKIFEIANEVADLIPFEQYDHLCFPLLKDAKSMNSLKMAFSLPMLKCLQNHDDPFIALAFSCLETEKEMRDVHQKIEDFSKELFRRQWGPYFDATLIRLMCILSKKFPVNTWGSLNDLFINAIQESDPKFIESIYPGLACYIESANIPEESLLFQLFVASQFRLDTKDNYDNPFRVYRKLMEESKKEIDFNQIMCHTDVINGYEVNLCPEFIMKKLFQELTLKDLPKSHDLLFDFYEKQMGLAKESKELDSQDLSLLETLKKYLQLTEGEATNKALLSDLKVKFMQIVDYFYSNKEMTSEHLLHPLKQIKGCPAGTSMGINDVYAQMHLGLSAGGLATDYEQNVLGICREIFGFVINSGTNHFYKQLCQVKRLKETETGQFVIEEGEIERQDGETVQGAHGVTYVRNLLGLNTPIQMDWYTRGLSYFLLECTKKDAFNLLFQEGLTPKYFVENFRFFFGFLNGRKDIQEAYIKLGLFTYEEYWDCTWGLNEDGEDDIISSRISDLAILRILNHLGVMKIHKLGDLNDRSLINPWK